jgi:hypothetical protein
VEKDNREKKKKKKKEAILKRCVRPDEGVEIVIVSSRNLECASLLLLPASRSLWTAIVRQGCVCKRGSIVMSSKVHQRTRKHIHNFSDLVHPAGLGTVCVPGLQAKEYREEV